MNLSLGKRRRLQQASSVSGALVVLAIDHRGPLRRRLATEAGVRDIDQTLVALKQDIVSELASLSSAVLLDPDVGLDACARPGVLPGQTGLLVALDTGSTGDPAVSTTGLVEGWSVDRIARVGGAGVKLLVYYHPEAPDAGGVEKLVHEIGRACAQAEMPFYLEPLSYCFEQPDRPLSASERRRVVIDTAHRLPPLGIDVLKTEFPVHPVDEPDEAVWREACRELSAACPVPWVLLSAGVSSETFLRQTEIACEAGASGVMAGRAIWNEAVSSDGPARRRFLRGEARERLARLRSVCDNAARPWWQCFSGSGARVGDPQQPGAG